MKEYKKMINKVFGNSTEQLQKDLEQAIQVTPKDLDDLVNRSTKVIEVDHPPHYGGESDPYEAIKVIEAWQLGFNLGNTLKYICRAGKKDQSKTLQDLKKAKWYLEREISNLENL